MKFNDTSVGSDNLVPADFGVEPDAMTTDTVNKALTAKCIDKGFTGCHVWKITAKSTQTLESASILLNLKVGGSGAEADSKWSYAVFTSESSEDSSGGDNIVNVTSLVANDVKDQGSFNSISGEASDIHQAAGLIANNDQVYYLMVYIQNEEKDQLGDFTDTNSSKANYSGTVTLNVAGTGQVKATFTAE